MGGARGGGKAGEDCIRGGQGACNPLEEGEASRPGTRTTMGKHDLIGAELGRLVIRDNADRQYIYVVEAGGSRGFPIVIGNAEAGEIYRVLHGDEPPRPLTHQLAFSIVQALDASIQHVDIVDLKHNTFYAQLTLENEKGDVVAVVDARPSDAIALALRARCGLRVAEDVFDRATEDTG